MTNGLDVQTVKVGKGLRQGCKAAPFLWNCFLQLLLRDLSQETDSSWLTDCLNIFADDFQVGCVFRSCDEFYLCLKNLGIILHKIQQMGLTINLSKSAVQLVMAGTSFRRTWNAVRHKEGDATWIVIPLPDGAQVSIPLVTQIKYLGIILSYGAFEDQTVTHRVHLAKHAFSRLRRWLCGRHGLTVHQRFKLWQTCVFTVLKYGILAMPISKLGLHTLQKSMYAMLRQIIGDHAYITRRTHQQALSRFCIDLPLEQLRVAVASCHQSITQRTARLPSHDIVHTQRWTHFEPLIALIDDLIAQGRSVPIDSQITVEPETQSMLHCPHCNFQTTHAAVLKRHTHIEHAVHHFRVVPNNPADFATQGLPACKFCPTEFPTWRLFQIHIERGCSQVSRAQDTGKMLGRSVGRADKALRGNRMLTDAELQHLRSLEFGPRVLEIVANRSWRDLTQESAACQYLTTTCCLCGHYAGRTQALNLHFRQHHAQFWEHVPQKGTQLTNMNANESPCDYCGFIFKSSHMCNVFTQVALLLLHGGGIADASPRSLALQCEICRDVFLDEAALQRHLSKQHNLMVWAWNPSRDSVAGSPACAHCGFLHETLEGLRAHITAGNCKHFNPAASAESLEMQPKWKDACLHGTMSQILFEAESRLELTLSCQSCGRTYTRPHDLAAHLQTAHAGLWQDSQALTMVLVSVLYPNRGCICNPGIGQTRHEHICQPLRQLAMQYCRLPEYPFWPFTMTDKDFVEIFPKHLPRAARFQLEQLLTAGQFQHLAQDGQLLQTLRTTCICCGVVLSPALLHAHVREAHSQGHLTVQFYATDILPAFIEIQTTDHTCSACHLIFNHAQAEDAPADGRQILVQQHLLAQCPCLLQTAVLLAAALHGRGFCDGAALGGRSSSTAGGGIPEHGSAPGGQKPPPRTQSKRNQEADGATTRPTKRQDKRSTRSGAVGSAPHSDGKACAPTRTGPEPAKNHGQLCSLFQPKLLPSGTNRRSTRHPCGNI